MGRPLRIVGDDGGDDDDGNDDEEEGTMFSFILF
jgi:hypothetical protein